MEFQYIPHDVHVPDCQALSCQMLNAYTTRWLITALCLLILIYLLLTVVFLLCMCEKAFLNVFFCVSYDTGFEGVYIYSNLIIAEKKLHNASNVFFCSASYLHTRVPAQNTKDSIFLNITKTTCSYLLGIYMFDI